MDQAAREATQLIKKGVVAKIYRKRDLLEFLQQDKLSRLSRWHECGNAPCACPLGGGSHGEGTGGAKGGDKDEGGELHGLRSVCCCLCLD